MKSEVLTYMERPKRYDYIDGTGDMFFGLALMGFALSIVLEGLLPAGAPRWTHLVPMCGAFIPVVGLYLWLRRFIKTHWTWKRTGYVAYRRGVKWWVVVAASAPIGAVVTWVLVLMERHAGVDFARAFIWVVYPAGYAFWSFFTSREHLWKWLVFLLMVLGLVALGLPVHGDFERVGWQTLLFLGLVWFGSGVGTLLSYVRHTQPSESQAQ